MNDSIKCDDHTIIFKNADWIGDTESETGGRIGLWKICERNEISDVCIGKLEDVLEMPTMSSQVSGSHLYFFRTRDLIRNIIARHNICWNFSCDLPPHHTLPSFYDISQVNNSFSSMRMDANLIG